jgi:hypothetical protein
MGVGRTEEGVSVVSESDVLVMFVTLDREFNTKKIFRRTPNGTNPEGWRKKTKEVIKSSNNHIF